MGVTYFYYFIDPFFAAINVNTMVREDLPFVIVSQSWVANVRGLAFFLYIILSYRVDKSRIICKLRIKLSVIYLFSANRRSRHIGVLEAFPPNLSATLAGLLILNSLRRSSESQDKK